MASLILTLLIAGRLLVGIEIIDRPEPSEFAGDYLGTSLFTPADTSRPADTVAIWFTATDSTYMYGPGDAFPTPEPAPQFAFGHGPCQRTDSTITFDGVYPKILRPAIILQGEFSCVLTGDTLRIAAEHETPIKGEHNILLLRR